MSDWASPTAQSVRRLVYQTFAQQGRAASPAELASELELDPADVLDALRELHDRHALVLTPAGDAIRMAHPFSAAPMGFVVRADDRFWWGGCAWDSFGITAALDRQMEITTCCAGCGRKLVYVAGPATPPTLPAVVLIPLPAREWWDNVVATCSSIRVYCRRTEMPTLAESVPLLTLWQLAQPWYGDRIDQDWTPHTNGVRQRLLDDVGLAGPFWRLPD
jgi:alkylmercury lyase-like protein